MANFTTIKAQCNTGTNDASPTWTDAAFGSSGVELRASATGNGATTTTSAAAWPSVLKPGTGASLLDLLYLFTADTTGSQINTYDGTGSHYNQWRLNWDAVGTFGSAPIISAWASNSYPAASPGTQPGTGSGAPLINGSTETSNTSGIKAAAYGFGRTSGGSADNPSGNMGSNPSATSGSAGATTTSTGAWSSWTSLQADTQYIQNGTTPAAVTAGTWNIILALYLAAGMSGGTYLPEIGVKYTYI